MFKIESYITPLLMGYIDKYVKLKHEDFQLSLWGGDAVLNKLDLRLDAIEEMLNLPITFKSGHIYELRIHVPWTKLGSEPVVITINTIECILKLRESAGDNSDAGSTSTASTRPNTSQAMRPKMKRQDTDDLPPGYLQSLINKVINNVNIVINNLILKFVEDDIVLSANVKSAECYSVNHEWLRSFTELSMPELVLRKVINFHDLTVCLDKRNADGKIETYQDPFLYRCSLTCRMHMIYDSLNSKMPTITKFNLLCEELNLSLTDTQVPMFFRLMELCIAIYYGSLELPGAAEEHGTENLPHQIPGYGGSQDPMDPSGDIGQESWSSWAWSYVPQILPAYDEDEEYGDAHCKQEPPVLCIGFYISKASITFKLSKLSADASFGPSKMTFKPCMTWYADGISLEMLLRGLYFFNAQFGICSTHVVCQGDALCGGQDIENTSRDPMFLRSTLVSSNHNPDGFKTNSLFDPGGAENQSEKPLYTFDHTAHLGLFTESYALQRHGALWLDYIYTMEEPPEATRSTGSERSAGSQGQQEELKEDSTLRFIVGPLQLILSSSSIQRMQKFYSCVYNHDYEPYMKPLPEPVDDTKGPPTEAEVMAIQEFIAKRSYQVTFIQPTVWLKAASLPLVDASKTNASAKRRRKSKSKTTTVECHKMETLPMLVFHLERFDMTISSPMYPYRIARIVSKMTAPPEKLLLQAHSHTYFKVASGLVGLSRMEADGSVDAIQNIIQPWNATVYDKNLMFPVFWHNPLQPRHSRHVDLSGLTLTASNPQLLLVAHILLSWLQPQPRPNQLSQLSLLKEVFEDLDSEGRPQHAVLQCSLLGVKGTFCSSPAAWSLQMIVETILSQMLQAGDSDVPQVTPLLHSQVDTSCIPNQWFFQQPLGAAPQPTRSHAIIITAQIPTNAETPAAPTAVLVQVKGLVGCLDTVLFDWLSYAPQVSQLANQKAASGSMAVPGIVDQALADSTSPLKNKQTSQGSQTGSNHTTAPTETQTRSFSRTQSRSALNKQVSMADDAVKTTEEISSEADSAWGRQLAKLFPVIKIMQVQVDIEHTSVFFPRRHIKFPEPRGMSNIPRTLHEMFTRRILPETLVVSFPKVKLHSVGHKPVGAMQILPIKTLTQSVAGEKLPWTVEISGASVYTIHQSSQLHYLAEPASVSATVAVTTKYTPPMSDNITSLGLVLHADLDTMVVACSQRQMQLLYDLCQRGVGVSEQLLSSYQILMETMASPDTAVNQTQDTPTPQALLTSPALPARPSNHNMSTSSQWETPDPVVTITATSEDLSRETTPVRELESGSEVKLSLWLQWTLPKFLLKLYGEQAFTGTAMCLVGELEDLNSSVDVQDVYAKVKCRVGAFNVKHLEKNVGRAMWQTGSLGGILLTCDDRLNRNVQVAANRVWSPQGMAKPNLFGDIKPRDKTHGFINFTYTRALRRNVKKRLRRLNGDEQEAEKKERNVEMTDHGVVYLNEVCLNIHPCDVVVNCPVICDALSVLAIDMGPSKSAQKATEGMESVPKASSLPILVSNILPLLYITMANLRLFVPICEVINLSSLSDEAGSGAPHKKDTDKEGHAGHPSPDVCVVQLSALSITPQADNPLPRIVLEKALYRQAVHMGMAQQPGAEIEDRQYQLDIASLGMATGCWQDFLQTPAAAGLKAVEVSVQNPALEWNNLCKAQEQYGQVHLIPIASSFDLRVVAAPAITYTPSPTFPDYKEPLLVCGYSLEVNATSDMDFFLSTSQVQLGLDILNSNLAAFQRLAYPGDANSLHGDFSFEDLGRDELGVTDSGVESEFSVFITPEEDATATDGNQTAVKSSLSWADVTPFEVLLTAGKISCMVYTYAETETSLQATQKLNQGLHAKPGKCKTDLDWKGETQSVATLSSADSGLESMAGYVAKEAACGGAYQQRIVPYLYAHFSQPHTLLNCHPGAQRAELSCYDIILKGAKSGYAIMDEGRLIPELSDYAIHWVETRPGQPSPKTGIPPSLYTLTLTDFLSHPAQVWVKFERPLKLNCSPSKLEQTLSFWRHLEPIFTSLTENPGQSAPAASQTKPTVSPSGNNPPAVLKSLIGLDSIHVSMVQLVVAMEMTSDLSEQLGAQVSFTKMEGMMDLRVGEKGWVDDIVGTLDINDLMAKTAYAAVWQPLFGPVTFSVTLRSQWQPSSGPGHLPIMHCSVDAGVLQCYLGQEHVMAATGIATHLANYAQTPSSRDVKHSSTSGDSVQKVRRKSSHQKPPAVTSEVKVTEDDLRAGDFQYVAEEVERDYIPQTGEICFSRDALDGTAVMAWSYTHPRIISHLVVTPVPLSVPAIDVRYMEENIKVSCILQYWDPLTKEFVSHCDFQISENETCSASLPEVSAEHVDEIVAAMTWRILILHPEKQTIQETEDGECIELEPLISPLTLAASLRVDSVFDPRFVQIARCSLKCELLEVHFVNHLAHFGKGTPQKLVPFTLAESPVSSQEYMTLSLDRPRFVLDTLDGQFKRLNVKASSFIECQVLEYGCLTMQPLLEPIHVQLQTAWLHHDMYPRVETRLKADHLQLRVGASAIHTLNGAAQLWAQVSAPDPAADRIPLHYYLLCNDTQECLHVKQAGTEENLVLLSRESLPYSWRSQRAKPVLIISLGSSCDIWCEPFELHTDGSTVRFIEGKGQRSTLIIRIKQVTGVQKQITISGLIGVASLLSQHLEVKMLTQKQGESLCVLGARHRLPSYIIEQEQVRAIRVRLMGIKTPWSQEVVICGEKMKQTRLLKIPLYDKTGYIHVWCHIFVQNYNAAQHHLLVFAPLFVVRSQLPAPLLVNVDTPRLKSSQQVQVKGQGQGQEEQLHLVAGDMTHAITFQLSNVMQTSSPAISLSSGMIEQVERQAASDADIDVMGTSWMDKTSVHWPYNHLESDRNPEFTRSDLPSPSHHEVAMATSGVEPPLSADFVAMEQPNIDLQVALTQWYPGCNTLLIDVAPYWMIVNETQLNFMILEKNDRQWNLAKMQTFAPPQFEGSFQLGIIDGGFIHLSDHISLAEDDHTYRYHADLEGVLYRMGHIKILIPIRRGGVVTQVCYLVMHSTMKDNLRIVTIRNRYVLSCQSHNSLLVQGHAVPLSMNKVALDYSQSLTTQCSPLAALSLWNISKDISTDAIGSLHANSVLYVTFRQDHVHQGEGQTTVETTDTPWSIPVRIRISPGGSRCNVVVPHGSPSTSPAHQFVLTCHESCGVAYLVLREETYPVIEIHNNCTFPLQFGQSLMDISMEGVTVQEEAELTEDIPLVAAQGTAYYAFPACNSTFPESIAPENLPKLHLAGHKVNNEPVTHWSHGIDIAAEHDIFVSIPNLSDVKVHVEKVCYTTHVFIDPVSRAEISAKEIRSRIKGKETTVVVEGKTESKVGSPPRGESVMKKEEKRTQIYGTCLTKLSMFCEQCTLVVVEESMSRGDVSELLRVTADSVVVMLEPHLEHTLDHMSRYQPHAKYRLAGGVGGIQVDNQMYVKGFHDFPVILLPQEVTSVGSSDEEPALATSCVSIDQLKQQSVIAVDVGLTSDLIKHLWTVENLDVAFKPLTMYVEDVFIYDILKQIDHFIPSSLSIPIKSPHQGLPFDIQCASVALSHPIRLQCLTIQPTAIMLSVHASLKLFIASDNTPLKFGKFERRAVFTSSSSLIKGLAMHYASGALFRAGLVVGSLEILGNPTGLIRSIGTGVADLFRMPYQGLTKGPGAFIGGVTRGMTSLLRHISTGTLTSITNFASSVSRNMDRLSLDSDHCERQEESRRHKPAGLSQGLFQGLTGFGLSLLGAVAGLADQPLQSLQWAVDANVPTSHTRKATGIVSGVGKGLVGAVTKPIGGAAELVSQTGLGLLQGVGLTSFPKSRSQNPVVAMATAPNSVQKYLEKYLYSMPNAEVIMILPAVRVDSRGHLENMCLLLTPEVLFLINVKDDNQVQALAVLEVSTRGSVDDPCLLYVLIKETEQQESTWDEQQEIDNKDRLAAFIDGSTDVGGAYGRRNSLGPGEISSHSKQLDFQVDPRMGRLFLALMKQSRAKASGAGFTV